MPVVIKRDAVCNFRDGYGEFLMVNCKQPEQILLSCLQLTTGACYMWVSANLFFFLKAKRKSCLQHYIQIVEEVNTCRVLDIYFILSMFSVFL